MSSRFFFKNFSNKAKKTKLPYVRHRQIIISYFRHNRSSRERDNSSELRSNISKFIEKMT
jgi:hypothetical protein